MENAYSEFRTSSLPGFFSLFQNPARTTGRLVRALGIRREFLFYKKAVLPAAKWGEKNEVRFDRIDGETACKPIHVWSMILQENKIRKPQQLSVTKRR